MNFKRLFRHLTTSHWFVQRCFPRQTLTAIEQAVANSEHQHSGELRFVVEGPLPLGKVLRDVSARERAIELFSRLRVWDTAENSGILIYVQLADREVEIVADRGIVARVPQSFWDELCRDMERAFAGGDYQGGVLATVTKAGAALTDHFPAHSDNPNELPDRPLVL
jgi:uncharacterized membrane protein